MPLDITAVIVLAAAAFFTSIVSAVLGMGGGITFLAVMLLFVDPLIAIPLHGIVQLVSNCTRTTVQRKHVLWSTVWVFSLLLLPLGYLGLQLSSELPPELTKAIIGGFVLFAVWAKPWLQIPGVGKLGHKPRFFLLGCITGLLNTTIGAIGPLIAPFFLNQGLSRFTIIGTTAACAASAHVAKAILFAGAGFSYLTYAPVLAILVAMVIIGTWVGSQLLHKVNEKAFVWSYKGVLTAIAIHLIISALC